MGNSNQESWINIAGVMKTVHVNDVSVGAFSMWQQLSGSVQYLIIMYYWRASETLTGVTQLKIRDVCWRASKQARNTHQYEHFQRKNPLYATLLTSQYGIKQATADHKN